MKKFSFATVVALIVAPPLAAQTWSSNAPEIGPVNQPEGVLIHPYPSKTHYCGTGLQPVTVGGMISCGVPNTTERYYNGSGGHRHAPYCAPGTKGCS
ncbi:hypothetical protein J7413_02790 [Shimia sp. R10_1]|uniref:hypothetical protein n=1 Tax=Shimia sp. R10_1 TaxID=2821095 RepID=UPI001ADC2411|nr:hypothetical protein [Shimia sp. R10_1]MBO9472454.1 hypothetical protein [Shimia sp. R10_1]